MEDLFNGEKTKVYFASVSQGEIKDVVEIRRGLEQHAIYDTPVRLTEQEATEIRNRKLGINKYS